MAVDAARAKSLFLNASDLSDPTERAAYLERECSGDPELRGRVEALLQANDASPLPPRLFVATVDSDPDLSRSLAGASSGPRPEIGAGVGTSTSRRFRILRPHAKGGLGQVSVALDNELKREVALKEIQDRHADNPEARARFLLEGEITGKLEHPGIVPVYGLGQNAAGRPFYAMRFIKGDSLRDAIERFHAADDKPRSDSERTLELRKLLGRFLDVCNAIAYAHSRGVLHRDLKPGNIMLGQYGETLVVDWGMAKMREHLETASTLGLGESLVHVASGSGSAETAMGRVLGTPAYMSPEQAAGRLHEIGPTSDVYSLGATLYCLLTGKAPIEKAKDVAEVLGRVQKGDFPKPRTVNPKVPAALEAICLKAMALRQEDRYAKVRALAEDVERWLADDPVSAWAEPLRVKARRWVNRHRTLVTSAAAVALVGLFGLLAATFFLSQANERLQDERDKVSTALAREEFQKKERALSQVNALCDAAPGAVPGILRDLEANQAEVLPRLRERYAAEPPGLRRMRLALAILPGDPEKALAELEDWMLQTESPAETLLARDALAPHKQRLLARLWKAADSPPKGKESQALRAAAALAQYDPEDDRWSKLSTRAANDLVLENPLFLGQWSEAFLPVSGRLVAPLSVIFRDRQPARAGERKLATILLADYAANQPLVLADLLMDAEEQQFAVLFPKVKVHGARSASSLLAEIDKKPDVKEKLIFESRGRIADSDAKFIRVPQGPLPTKLYEVRLQTGTTYRLTMESKDFDSFLAIKGPTGNILRFDNDSGGDLDSLIVFAPFSEGVYTLCAASFKGTGSFVLKVVETLRGDGGKEILAKRQANAAVALLKMGQPEKVWPLLKHSPDPRARSYLIHRLSSLGADAGVIVKHLEEMPDMSIRRALILSMGDFGEKQFPLEDREALVKKLKKMYQTDADPGLHAASEWLLRTWKQEAWLNQMNRDWAADKVQRNQASQAALAPGASPQWYVNGQGQTMVAIPGPVEFLMGSPPREVGQYDNEPQHKRQIGRTYALAAKAVTMAEYRRFNKAYTFTERYAPTPACPVVGMSWHQAAAYCNWLSKQEDIPEDQWCFDIDAKGLVSKLKANYLSLTGYRLPTEAELEYATRAGAVTSRCYGETEELLAKYAWYQKNGQMRSWPVGSLKPNDLGYFDVHGNVYCWCQESYKSYRQGIANKAAEDQEDGLAIFGTNGRILRGGSFNIAEYNVRSAQRNFNSPSNRNFDNGFRVARTITADAPDLQEIARILSKAVEYQRAGKIELALPLYKKVLEKRRAKLGPDHPATLNSQNSLAVSYWQARHLDKSIPLFEDALKRLEAKFGRDHPETLRTAANLGVNYLDAGRLAEAIPLLEEANGVAKKHATLGWVRSRLLQAYTKAGEHAKLGDLLRNQLAETRKSLAKDSPQLAGILAQISVSLLEQKKWAEAEPLLRECLAIRATAQPDGWSTFNTQSMLGGALLGQKKYADAEPLLLSGYEGMKQQEKAIPPQDKLQLPEVIERLVQLYEATDNKDEATKWRKTLENQAGKLVGPVHEVGQGLELRGQLDRQTPTLVYQVKLAAGNTYVIDMASPDPKALDPYLVLTDAAGKKLAEDDDSGGGLNARIVFRAEQAGTFRIRATTFNNGAGAFTLTVRERANATKEEKK